MDPLVFVIVVVAIISGTIVTLIKSGREHDTKTGSHLSDEETRVMQEIHQSLNKMEKRVEALETIIINRK